MNNGLASLRDLAFNRRLIEAIKQYWISQGYEAPQLELQDLGFERIMRGSFHGIRSDMINGMPRNKAVVS